MKQTYHIATLLAATALSAPFIDDPEQIGQISLTPDFITAYSRNEMPPDADKKTEVTLKTAIRVDENTYLVGLASESGAAQPSNDQFKVVAKILSDEEIEQVAGKYNGVVKFALMRFDDESGQWNIDRTYENVVDAAKVDVANQIWLGMADGTIHYLDHNNRTIGQRVGGDLAIEGIKSIARPYLDDKDNELRVGFNTLDGKYYQFKVTFLDNYEAIFVAEDVPSDLNVEVYAKQGDQFVVSNANGQFENLPTLAAAQAAAV